ncbi:SRPBCC family protein [Chthonobacter albigriseus]|uniref:SRPBCC family protein n=1 Tax=Chthonobacter albigriseus TaxID=1683161 RepID=UPI0015EF0880|nr:carbon monoxide dehydrogenase subunit G [Chthonobacter albigriseus]
MQMNDSQRIPAPRAVVWAALNDPEVLKACIPGCESLEMTSPTEMTAKVQLKVGPVKATFGGKVTLSDLDPPNGYRITGEGSGGVAGFAKGGAVVRLAEDGPDTTILSYEVDAQIGGKLAQLGSRLIDSTARKLAGEFFATFSAVVAPPQETAESPIEEAAPAAEGQAPTKGWFKGLFGRDTAAGVILGLALLAGAFSCCLDGTHAHAADLSICTGASAV